MSDQPLRQAVIEAGDKAKATLGKTARDRRDAAFVAAARTALEHVRREGLGNRWWTIGADDLLVALLAQLTPAGEEPTK